MSRPLKVFKTHVGFYDAVVATPSMKATAQAFGARPTIFAQGLAAQTQETGAVQAALSSPGQVLKRPHGQSGSYKLEPDAIAVPRLTAKQKWAAQKADEKRRRKETANKRARKAVEKKAQKDAEDELAAIEREEAELRERRLQLQQKFHIRSVK
jgi:TRAP-type C4-dicarboxylate transport system substrate-binding protein